MTRDPPNRGEFDDVDEFYRRVSAQDKDGPSESVCHAILEQAARLAEERKAPRLLSSTLLSHLRRSHDKARNQERLAASGLFPVWLGIS